MEMFHIVELPKALSRFSLAYMISSKNKLKTFAYIRNLPNPSNQIRPSSTIPQPPRDTLTSRLNTERIAESVLHTLSGPLLSRYPPPGNLETHPVLVKSLQYIHGYKQCTPDSRVREG
jgi:hypothetical protein